MSIDQILNQMKVMKSGQKKDFVMDHPMTVGERNDFLLKALLIEGKIFEFTGSGNQLNVKCIK